MRHLIHLASLQRRQGGGLLDMSHAWIWEATRVALKQPPSREWIALLFVWTTKNILLDAPTRLACLLGPREDFGGCKTFLLL